MSLFHEPIAETVWDIKYRYRLQDQIMDHSIEDTWRRIARSIAKAEKPNQRRFWEDQFYDALAGFRFLPGGRIIAGAGTKHTVTLFNCFVMPISDSLSGIFDGLKGGALTLQEGGGIGYDFSSLRPKGYPVKHSGTIASGPVSFMRIWNAMCATMLSTGARRGAMMAILRCDHPDIEEFITAKSDPHELRHFNVSVLVTDAFMQAVKSNDQWSLVFPLTEEDQITSSSAKSNSIVFHRWNGKDIPCRVIRRVNARELWQKIIKSAYDYAEPGVIFEDTINRMNTLWYREWISATNPCGEIPLPVYGACNLGSINLSQFVINPYSENTGIDWVGIEKTAAIAARFLDNVIDVSRYPLKMQKQEALNTRRIGLGITGLADLFVMMGLRYGSEESLQIAKEIMKKISYTSWETSIELAKERGSFPLFNAEEYLAGAFVQSLNPETREGIIKHGIRNSHHNTIAPTGTISLLANNVSNGIEPVFSAHYERTIRLASGELQKYTVTDYALRQWRHHHPDPSLPPAWTDSQTLMPEQHLKIQAVMQPYIDNSISKTINIPIDFPFEKLAAVYTEAYQLGLKGCTIFRPNPITGSILTDMGPQEQVDRCCILE